MLNRTIASYFIFCYLVLNSLGAISIVCHIDKGGHRGNFRGYFCQNRKSFRLRVSGPRGKLFVRVLTVPQRGLELESGSIHIVLRASIIS